MPHINFRFVVLLIGLLFSTASSYASPPVSFGIAFGESDGKEWTSSVDAVNTVNLLRSVNRTSARSLSASYRFNRYVSAELQYTNLGLFSVLLEDAQLRQYLQEKEVTATSLSIKNTLFFDDKYFYSKLGASHISNKTTETSLSLQKNFNNTSFYYGAGVAYPIYTHLLFFTEYQVFNISDQNVDQSLIHHKIKTTQLGFMWQF